MQILKCSLLCLIFLSMSNVGPEIWLSKCVTFEYCLILTPCKRYLLAYCFLSTFWRKWIWFCFDLTKICAQLIVNKPINLSWKSWFRCCCIVFISLCWKTRQESSSACNSSLLSTASKQSNSQVVLTYLLIIQFSIKTEPNLEKCTWLSDPVPSHEIVTKMHVVKKPLKKV